MQLTGALASSLVLVALGLLFVVAGAALLVVTSPRFERGYWPAWHAYLARRRYTGRHWPTEVTR